jgi:hypothetical protein
LPVLDAGRDERREVRDVLVAVLDHEHVDPSVVWRARGPDRIPTT